jgi:hypothetical protein
MRGGVSSSLRTLGVTLGAFDRVNIKFIVSSFVVETHIVRHIGVILYVDCNILMRNW